MYNYCFNGDNKGKNISHAFKFVNYCVACINNQFDWVFY